MEEEKTITPKEVLDSLKTLGKDCTASIPALPELRKTVVQYMDKSQQRPAPSFLGKRLLFTS